MLGYLIIILIPVGVVLSPELRSQPLMLVMAGVCVLAVIGLVYGKYREVAAQQGMMDQRKK